MLALTAPIKARLQALPQLAGWDVRISTEMGDRSKIAAAIVRMEAARVTDSDSSAVKVEPALSILLVVPRADGAANQLDAAFVAVIASLHDWPPGVVSGLKWMRLALASVGEPQFVDSGQAGIELTFITSASFAGHS